MKKKYGLMQMKKVVQEMKEDCFGEGECPMRLISKSISGKSIPLEFFAGTRTGYMLHIVHPLTYRAQCNSNIHLQLENAFASETVPDMLCNKCASYYSYLLRTTIKEEEP